MLGKKKSSGKLAALFSSDKDQRNGDGAQIPPVPSPNHLSPNPQPVEPNRLSKSSHERVPSATLLPPPAFPPPTTLRKPVPHAKTENLTLQTGTMHSRPNSSTSHIISRPGSALESRSRPTTPQPNISPTATLAPNTPLSANKVKRRSWLSSSRPSSKHENALPKAWILGHSEKAPYDTTPLLQAQQVGLAERLTFCARLLTKY